ncbi:MAG: FAD-binding oxidoreductase [Proteobacteria bacterium]|nr:FAD-binding oxidoreductase [Pseudomonadota bacterium]
MQSVMPSKQFITELQKNIAGEVRFDDGSRALYATDGSNYRQVPIGVVIPKTIEDVITTVKFCHQYQLPVLSRGGGTSLAGQCCNEAVILDFSKYLHRVIAIDPQRKIARVQPGCNLDTLRAACEQYHLTFGPDPSTHAHNTLGGMVGNDSCGTHSVLAALYGEGARTADNIAALEILTYSGTRMKVGRTTEQEINQIIQEGNDRGRIYGELKNLRDRYADLIRQKFPNIPRRVSGYNLEQLLPENHFNVARALVGSEGTCIILLEITVNLVYSPPARSLLLLGYPDIFKAADHVPEIMKFKPTALEAIDNLLVQFMKIKSVHKNDIKLLPKGKGWLLAEFGAVNKVAADQNANKLKEHLEKNANAPAMKLIDSQEQEKIVWKIRESGLGATADLPNFPNTWPGWEDSAVPIENLACYLQELKKLFGKFGYKAAVYGHFGQGCIHCRIPFDLITHKGIQRFHQFMHEAARLVVKYQGSLSGEHGDGQARAELLPIMFGEQLVAAFGQFKKIWDPDWKLNPGKVVNPHSIVDNLRLGTQYHPWNPQTEFNYLKEKGSFAQAAALCVGVGQCRRTEHGTMCPSYRATREEQHSTRGRARLLFEMLQRQVIGKKGWKDQAVRNALDLCLSCKGCKKDCPVNVDMAKYKAEFLHHYYQGSLRPRSAYFFGKIQTWSQWLSRWPNFFNLIVHQPLLAAVAKWIAGMDNRREIPGYAASSFKQWYSQRSIKNTHGPIVILWADTFNNYFNPEIAQAAVEVLEEAGQQVKIYEQSVCCGRPLYDYGFLKEAKKYLQKILATLQSDIRNGIPVVVLEPSCLATFRDELTDLFPHDLDANRLHQQTFSLAEYLLQIPGYQPPKIQGKAVVHGHCHHKAIIGMSAEQELLSKTGLDFTILDSGCCGMAGSFGYERGEHYQISMKIGEEVLLPTLRKISKDTFVIADGFSCRTQIIEAGNQKPLHLAELLKTFLAAG